MKKFFNGHNLLIAPFLFALFFTVNLAEAKAATVFGITNANQLVRFDSNNPGGLTIVGTITGLQPGETVLAIDFRPATGQLYALGSNSRIYTLNRNTGAATLVGALTTPLSGTSFGFDFNPVVDRIRVVSDADQNLRVNPNDGSNVVDGTLAYAAGDPNSGQNPNVVASAYTNNFAGATTTTLYNIDSNRDILVTQNPANSGTLQTVGSLGLDTTNIVGFDIDAGDGTAYATFTLSNFTAFYTINLTTGRATPIRTIGAGITDIAVEIGAASNFTVFGVTTTNNLVRFNSARPGAILSTSAITGLQAGETVLAIDFRPATGQLYALGSNSRLYTLNLRTGAATFVAPLSVQLNGTAFGFDFNPTVDRIRIVSNTGQNLRVNPTDGVTIVDGTLAYAGTDPNNRTSPSIVGSAYTNNFAGATTTQLYNIDSNLDLLVNQNPPNFGALITVGSLNVNATNELGFDIAPFTNTALAAIQVPGAANSVLYNVSLTNGSAAAIAPISGAVLRGIAIAGSTAVNSATTLLDFDGDFRTDFALFRRSNSVWNIRNSGGGADTVVQFGQSGTDILTPGDYDGDGRTDIAVWRTTSGFFFIRRSSDNTFQAFQFGQPGDEPVARDYDGDGRTDFAVVRRENGLMTWFIRNSSNGSVRAEQFGLATDVVAPGDYDGDGRFDIAVYRGAKGQQATFFVQRSTGGFLALQFGLGGDLVVPGDYDGDGRTDFAVVRRNTTYTWFILRSSDNTLFAAQYGTTPHLTAQGDYDGDGRTDIAVYDPNNAAFFVLRSSTLTTLVFPYGQFGDYAVANYDTH
jgi:hypothetical protein